MDPLQLVLTALLAVVAIGAVVWPILRPPRPDPANVPANQELAELTAKRDAALRAVKDLEFDYQTGKVSQEDYVVYERALKAQAVTAIQAVDAYQGYQQDTMAAARAELDTALEAQIAALRRTPPVPASTPRANGHTATTSAAAVAAAEAGDDGSATFCPQCGQGVHAGDRFCAHCGATLASPAVR